MFLRTNTVSQHIISQYFSFTPTPLWIICSLINGNVWHVQEKQKTPIKNKHLWTRTCVTPFNSHTQYMQVTAGLGELEGDLHSYMCVLIYCTSTVHACAREHAIITHLSFAISPCNTLTKSSKEYGNIPFSQSSPAIQYSLAGTCLLT